MKSSHSRPRASRPRDRFFDEKLRVLGRPVEEVPNRAGVAAGTSAMCAVVGVSLLGVTAMMAAPPVSEVPSAQPLEPVSDQVAGGVPSVPKAAALPTGEVPMDATKAAAPLVPQIGVGTEPVTPPMSLPANPPGSAVDGGAPEGELVPLDAPGLAPATSGAASLEGADATASAASAETPGPGLDTSREVSREILEQIQESGAARPWTFSLSAGVTYDDNIQFQQTSVGQLSDIILNTGFNSTYDVLSGNVLRSLNAVLGGSYVTYFEHSEFSGWNANAGLHPTFGIGDFSCSIDLNAAQMNAPDRLAGGFAVSRNYSGGVNSFYEISEKTRVTAAFNVMVMDFVQQSYQTQPFTGNTGITANIGGNYAVTAKTRLGGNYMWSSNEQEGFSSWSFSSINATAAWQATAKTGFTGSVGRQINSLSGVEGGDGPGWIGSLAGTWQASDRMTVTVGFNRSAAPAAVGGNGAMNFNNYNLGVSRTLTERLTASLQVNYRVDDYQDLAGSDQFLGREATFWNVNTSLSWRVSTRAGLQLSYQFQDNNSNFSAWNFSANRVGMNFTYSF